RHTRSKRDWSSDVCSSDLRMASNSVFTTSWMEAYRKSLDDISCVSSTPWGSSFLASSRNRLIWLFTSVALEPAVWKSIHEIPLRSEERRVGKGGRDRWAGG